MSSPPPWCIDQKLGDLRAAVLIHSGMLGQLQCKASRRRSGNTGDAVRVVLDHEGEGEGDCTVAGTR
jgi:hypothetical protein